MERVVDGVMLPTPHTSRQYHPSHAHLPTTNQGTYLISPISTAQQKKVLRMSYDSPTGNRTPYTRVRHQNLH